jgi:hypothetical protein
MVKELVEAYKVSREEDKEYRKELREIDLRERYVKLMSAAAKAAADMQKLGIDEAKAKALLQKPF